MNFGSWDLSVHTTVDAWKRIQTASKIKPDRIAAVDPGAKTGSFIGGTGELYETTLDSCSCFDFTSRGLPCKHVYRLAEELGVPVLDAIPRFDPYAAFGYDVEEDIDLLRSRCEAGLLTVDAFIKAADALHSSAKSAKRRPGRPRKQ